MSDDPKHFSTVAGVRGALKSARRIYVAVALADNHWRYMPVTRKAVREMISFWALPDDAPCSASLNDESLFIGNFRSDPGQREYRTPDEQRRTDETRQRRLIGAETPR